MNDKDDFYKKISGWGCVNLWIIRPSGLIFFCLKITLPRDRYLNDYNSNGGIK